jgi:hypothetical protein
MKKVFLREYWHPYPMIMTLAGDSTLNMTIEELRKKIELKLGECIKAIVGRNQYYEYDTNNVNNQIPILFSGTFICYPTEKNSICQFKYYNRGILMREEEIELLFP